MKSILTVIWPRSRPVRLLGLNEIVRTLGRGAVVAVLPLFLHSYAGVGVHDIAFASGFGAVIGVVVAVPAGAMINRFGSRQIAILAKILEGSSVTAMAWISGFSAVTTAFAVWMAASTAAAAAGGALVAHTMAGVDRVRTRAYLRTISNIGFSVGVAAGGVALALHSVTAGRGVLIVAGALISLSSLAVARLDMEAASINRRRADHFIALKDRRFILFVASQVVLSVNTGLLTLGLPLWVETFTKAPVWIYSPLLLLNAAIVTALQMRLSHRAESTVGAARSVVLSGVWYAAAVVVLIPTLYASAFIATALLVVAVALLSLGEILQSAGGWALSYELSPDHAHGSYQGLFATVGPVSGMINPFLIGATLLAVPVLGASILGFLFAGVSVATRALFSRIEPVTAGAPELPRTRSTVGTERNHP